MVERALGVLRFAPNGTLKNSPFEASHGRESNNVLRNLTEKPSLHNLNWDKPLLEKKACLDTDEPRTQRTPHPARTNWNMRSDVEYDQDNKSHPLKLTGNLISRDGLPRGEAIRRTKTTSKKPSRRSQLLF